MHFSQIIIPIICLIIFIDNKFVFKVNNIKTFVILCLFGLSFLFFARKQGLFAFIGLFLPMAYYVGSNISEVSEDNIKKLIYIITFGMMIHVLLNFCFDWYRKGFHVFYTTSHYDIWTLSDISETATSINYVFLYGTFYYILAHEKNSILKTIFIVAFIISSFYCVALGERTIIFILIISLFISFMLDCFAFKLNKLNKRIIKTVIYTIVLLFIVFTILYVVNGYRNNYHNYRDVIDMRLFSKFINKGIKTERLSILIETIKNAPQHLWGNNEISEIVGIMPHDLWSDVFDVSGIVPFVLLVVHTVNFVFVSVKLIKNNNVSKDFKLFICPLLLCILMQSLLEPIMSGASVFLLIIIVVEALIERLNIYAK